APAARRRGADPFRRADRLARVDRLRCAGRPEGLRPGAGTVRPRPPSGDRARPRAPGGRVAFAGAPAGPGHPRPARVLAPQAPRALPGFWRASSEAVKAEMKARSPRHPWPDDPLQAPPTRRAKPRGA